MQVQKQDLTSLFVDIGQDWSSRAIGLALARKGLSINDLEKELSLGKNGIRNVFYRECPRYEQAIAQKIGLHPSVIWPSRYASDDHAA
ncbi:helix-turn-helix domain-containing protein [Cedecea sp. NFIX57]|uniref:helix-turn-helix domain-containing protein n=1 Tax=Cedecea sp. NFIX57 TaxID=1566286 RepID=UPI000A0A9950|nr:helix-turn-helix domain-containing protein [Cedecea sp. NFIX57]SMG60803.1 transcriptional regulator, Nlp family [Cedecea sp. NFIX57]